MKYTELAHLLEEAFPKALAMEYDNPGLQCGRTTKEIQRVYIALDATTEVIKRAISFKADLLLTHHPLLFSSVKSIVDTDFVTKRVLELVENQMLCYAIHTNYDAVRMGRIAENHLGLLCGKPLSPIEEGKEEGIGVIGQLSKALSLKEMAEKVQQAYQLPYVRYVGDARQMVEKVAVVPGSGKSEIDEALRQKAQVLITGDLGHHDAVDAVEKGISLIDAGHYGLEYVFMEDMKKFLGEKAPKIQVEMDIVSHPFPVVIEKRD